MSLQLVALLAIIVFLLNGAYGKKSVECAGCSCSELAEQPFMTKAHNKSWWDKQKTLLQQTWKDGYTVLPMEMTSWKEGICNWSTACSTISAPGSVQVQTIVLMGFFDKRPMYNVTFYGEQIEFPQLSCSKDKTLNFHGNPIEFAGCINVIRNPPK